jgi:hypothetical protein
MRMDRLEFWRSTAPAGEDELVDLEEFSSRGAFLRKPYIYQLYFNLVRPNFRKENQSLWQTIERLAPPLRYNSARFQRYSWIIASTTQRVTIYLVISNS